MASFETLGIGGGGAKKQRRQQHNSIPPQRNRKCVPTVARNAMKRQWYCDLDSKHNENGNERDAGNKLTIILVRFVVG